jgi:hypothetical protein
MFQTSLPSNVNTNCNQERNLLYLRNKNRSPKMNKTYLEMAKIRRNKKKRNDYISIIKKDLNLLFLQILS